MLDASINSSLSVRESSASGRSANPAVILHTRVVTGTGGGPEKTILNSPRFLAPHGYRALCAFMHPPEDPGFEELQRRGAALGAPVLSVPDRGPFDVRVIRQLIRLCREEQVDIWHAHDYKSNVIGLIARRFWPMQLVTTAHGWVRNTWRTPLYYRLDRWAQRRYDKVICVSPDLLETVRRCGTTPEKSLLIDNAIDTELHQRQEPREVVKQRLGFRPRGFLIGAVGRLSEEKGFKFLIEAVARLLNQGHDVELAIAGDGDERAALEQLIAAQPDPQRFRLMGFQGELSEFYQALDAYALSSLREGLPNVLLEAMAYEVPVVATQVGGVARLVEHEQNGVLVSAQDESALSEALAGLLANPERTRRLASEGRRSIESRFSFAARMDRIRAVYEEVLATRPTGRRA